MKNINNVQDIMATISCTFSSVKINSYQGIEPKSCILQKLHTACCCVKGRHTFWTDCPLDYWGIEICKNHHVINKHVGQTQWRSTVGYNDNLIRWGVNVNCVKIKQRNTKQEGRGKITINE